MFGHSCAGNRTRPRSLKFSITRGHSFGQIFAMYLLAKFREPRAYVSLVKIVFKPGETAFDRMGDVVRFGTRWRILRPIFIRRKS